MEWRGAAWAGLAESCSYRFSCFKPETRASPKLDARIVSYLLFIAAIHEARSQLLDELASDICCVFMIACWQWLKGLQLNADGKLAGVRQLELESGRVSCQGLLPSHLQ
jgi:hypothetical protein